MDIKDYCRELIKSYLHELEEIKIEKLTDEQLKEKLEFLVNAPMTHDGYMLVCDGIYLLRRKCSANKQQDKRIKEAAYQKVIKMLEEKPLDSEAESRQVEYATVLLSRIMDSPMPKKYASRLEKAVQKFYQKTGKEDDTLNFFMHLVKKKKGGLSLEEFSNYYNSQDKNLRK